MSFSIALKGKPRPDGGALAQQLFGLTLRTVTPALARRHRLARHSGLVVVAVEPGSPAVKLGIKPRDILFMAGRHYVKDLDDLGMLLEDISPGQGIRIGIARGHVRALVVIYARKLKRPRTRTSKPSLRPTAPSKQRLPVGRT